jgi:alkylhydroperoxidase family enzyme
MTRLSKIRHCIFAVLCLSAIVAVAAPNVAPAEEAAPQGSRFPVLDDEAAWKRLPEVEETSSRSLPLWARMLAASLPQTTAVMLEQDYAYRTSLALDPKLRAKMRWVAADANRCEYARAYAVADLKRAGATDAEIGDWKERPMGVTAQEQAALEFAGKMTSAAYTVTDEEVQKLIGYFDEPTVVAMVLQMAFANFQDRLLLALNVPVEPGGPLPPLEVHFVPLKPGESIAAASRDGGGDDKQANDVLADVRDEDWQAFNFDQLQQQLERQRARAPRVSVPEWKDVQPLLPAALFPPDRPMRIKWSLAVCGHQPQLGMLWLKGLRTFGREAKNDRVFEESLFWVVTRSLQCFY